MCDLSEAFVSLLHKPQNNTHSDIFKEKWYSYEAEQNYHEKAKDTLDTILPTIEPPKRMRLPKKKTPSHFDDNTLFSHCFKSWSERDLLIIICIFQLFLFITIVIK